MLDGWRMLLDGGSLQDGEDALAGTARTPVVRLSEATAAEVEDDPPVEACARGRYRRTRGADE